ncbi:O-antigen ligase family protein [Patescibacteria group bacterium]
MMEGICILIFTILFAWVAWRRLDWAIALVLFLLPTYQFRFTLWSVPMTFLEIMLLVIIVIWLIHRIRSKSFKKIHWPWKWLTLGFFLAGVIAVIVSPDTRGALGLWKAYIVEPLLFFYVFVNVMKSSKHWRLALFSLGASVVVIGFVALIEYIGLIPGIEPYISQIPPRATSLFLFPTAIGKYVGPLVALFLGFLLVTKSNSELKDKNAWLGKAFFIGVVTFGLIGLLLSISRGAILGVFAALIFVSFFSQWKKWLWLGLGLLVVVIILIPQTRDQLNSVVSGDDVSTDVRLVMWKGTLRLIQDKPIFGAGLAGFPIVYADYKEASHTEFFPNPDHLILTLWVEMGILGLIIFGWIIVRFFTSGIHTLRSVNHIHKTLIVALFAAMIAFVVHGFVDTPYFKNDLAVIFWVLIGLLIVISIKSIETGQNSKNTL